MKRRFALLLLALTVNAAGANDTVSIDFDVTLEAAACTPVLSNNGKVDFGARSMNSLSTNAFTQLGTRELTLTITCESSTAVAITARDTRPASAVVGKDKNGGLGPLIADQYVGDVTRTFGLGVTAENKPIGSYAVLINAAGVMVSEGSQQVSVDIAGAGSKSGPWAKSEQPVLPATEDYFYTFVKKGTVAPQPLSSASIPLTVSAAVANALGSSQKITLDGEAVISLVYL
ncbi:DUF1120 domain-containing protein [Leclercia sp.]|uniref:DUF1120 domain-containing protein n=1 Tax=Leclercia sp. TaxID=1898428 RepID=UPI002FDDC9C5